MVPFGVKGGCRCEVDKVSHTEYQNVVGAVILSTMQHYCTSQTLYAIIFIENEPVCKNILKYFRAYKKMGQRYFVQRMECLIYL
jgi:hypothetical protein